MFNINNVLYINPYETEMIYLSLMDTFNNCLLMYEKIIKNNLCEKFYYKIHNIIDKLNNGIYIYTYNNTSDLSKNDVNEFLKTIYGINVIVIPKNKVINIANFDIIVTKEKFENFCNKPSDKNSLESIINKVIIELCYLKLLYHIENNTTITNNYLYYKNKFICSNSTDIIHSIKSDIKNFINTNYNNDISLKEIIPKLRILYKYKGYRGFTTDNGILNIYISKNNKEKIKLIKNFIINNGYYGCVKFISE